LDGATWRVMDDLLLENHMPNLNRLKTTGWSGVLQSTHPPVTPAAWTTCITGCQPYTHGVVGFKDYSSRDDNLRISSASSCCVPNMWEELSRQGYKVASINVPWTYPCSKVDGFIIAGYGLPGTEVQFTCPPELKGELLDLIPDYDVSANWEKEGNVDAEKFDVNVSRAERCFQQRLETAKLLYGKTNLDVMMVEFQDLDLMQHHIWPYLDKDTRDKYPAKRDRLFRMFEKLDAAIGSLLELAEKENTTVAVVSDHGFGPMLGSIKANMLLHKWGYLKFKSYAARMIRRFRRNLGGNMSEKKSEMSIEMKTPIDWKRSKAMVMYAAMNGHIYLNVKGRNPFGHIERGREYDDIIADLRQRFLEVTDPATGENVFTTVVTPKELYDCGQADTEKLGDLVIIPRPGYIVHQTATQKGDFLTLQPEDSLAGCHYYEGIYIFCGPNVKPEQNKPAHIVDFAPTIYAALGAEMPAYLDGVVLQEIFRENVKVRHPSSEQPETQKAGGQEGLSEEEQILIRKKLAELGYMD